jgi:hypothetical protein
MTGAIIIASLPPVKSRDWRRPTWRRVTVVCGECFVGQMTPMGRSQDDSDVDVNESTAPNFQPCPVYARFTPHRLIFRWVLSLGRRPVDHYGQRSPVIFPAQIFTAFIQCFQDFRCHSNETIVHTLRPTCISIHPPSY